MSEAGVEVTEATSVDRDGWDRFVAAHPASEAGHRWALLDALHEVFGQRGVRLVAKRGDAVVGVLPLVVQKSFVGRFATSVPYLNHAGVLCEDAVVRRVLAEAAARVADEEGVDRLELRGRDGSDLPLPVWPGKNGYTMELPPSEEALNAALGAKLRSQIRRPRKEGCEVAIEDPLRGRAAFYGLLARKWHELGSPLLPRSFFEAMEEVFGSDLEYVIVRRSNVPVAAGVLLRGGARGEIPWAASDPSYDRISVNMLLYWGALTRAIERGAAAFDFGRSTPGSGTARFKLQWGAVEHPLLWNVRARGDRGRASEPGGRGRSWAAAIWRRLPAAAARSLGPALAARVPL
jgi:FemAB-related protein (PEP-CTERM system-associated)